MVARLLEERDIVMSSILVSTHINVWFVGWSLHHLFFDSLPFLLLLLHQVAQPAYKPGDAKVRQPL